MIAACALPSQALCLQTRRVKTIEEIRHENLLAVLERFGTLQAFADKIGRAHSQISQLKNRSVSTSSKKPRNLDTKIARLIEEKLELEPGWMDNDHSRMAWPFPAVDRTQWEALSAEDRMHVQRTLNALLAQYGQGEVSTATSTGSGEFEAPVLHEPRRPYVAVK